MRACICAHVGKYVYVYIPVCIAPSSMVNSSRNKDTSVAVSTPSTQILVFSIISQAQEPKLLGKMAGSRGEAE